MAPVARDTRLVQTAVIGDEHSDVPVAVPPEAIELDQFRQVHQHDTFWCGLLLGGCGGQLTTRLYLNKACHFSHHPLPGGVPRTCRRSSVGTTSADHLYVKSALNAWLVERGQVARFAFPHPIGSLLDVDLEDGTALRVHMDGAVPPDWTGGRTVVLGPGLVPDPQALAGCPYVNRVRCDSDGAGRRRVWIGTQSFGHATDWVSLSDCAWTSDGLVTPAAAQILRRRPEPAAARRSATVPTRLPGSVVRLVRGLDAAQRSGSIDHVRRLLAGSGPFLDELDPAVRSAAERALDQARAWLTAHEEYQQKVFAQLQAAVTEGRAWDVRSGLQQAAALTRRGASAAEQRTLQGARAFLRAHDHVGRSQLPAAPAAPRRSGKRAAKARQAAGVEVRTLLRRLDRHGATMSPGELRSVTGRLSRAAAVADGAVGRAEHAAIARWNRRAYPPAAPPAPRASAAPTSRVQLPPHDSGVADLHRQAGAVKAILIKAAARGETLTWAQIYEQLPAGIPTMARADQIPVLVRVDTGRNPREGLLCALVTGADHDMHPAYPRVLAALGRAEPSGRLEALAHWAVEVSRVQSSRGTKRNANPGRRRASR